MKERLKAPELRFPGFTDDWEERKLSDLFIKGGSGGTPKSTNKAFYDGDIPFLGISDITKSNGFINNTEKHISSDGLNSSAAWIVSKGAISLAMYASVGKLAILNIDAATSQAFYNMIFDDYDLRDLVYQRLNKANELSEWNKLISTGTQSNLNADKVKNFQMYLPKNHDEIKLISTFFKQIDNTITLHQRKLDLLKEQKKGYLQKMFPKNGEKVPELRFAGFADDWEQRKLGEESYIKSRIGWQRLTKDEQLVTGDYYLITGTDIDETTHTIDYSRSVYVSKERYEKDANIQVKDGDIIVTKDGTIGKIAMITNLDKPATLNSHLFVLRDLSNKINNRFLLHVLESPEFKKFVEATKTGSTLTGLPQKTFINFKYYYPSLKEQKLIAIFFDNFDNLITLHQRKLDLLKEQKKGFLQKMFI